MPLLQMWIYSLGITLRRTIQSTSATSQQRKALQGTMHQQQTTTTTALANYENDGGRGAPVIAAHQQPSHGGNASNGHHPANDNDNEPITNNMYKHLTSLDYVVRTMCAPNLHYRASLMYLLDVSTNLDVFFLLFL